MMDCKGIRLQSQGVYGFVIALFCIAPCILPLTNGETASACYGTDRDCDYYSLTCPENQLIKLGDLFAGRKNEQVCLNTSSHCSQKDLCCSRAENDTIEQFTEKNVYDTYNNCSGQQSCLSVQSPWQLLISTTQTSTYVEINYNCVASNSPLKFCSMEARTNSYLELMFDGTAEMFMPSDVGKECRCELSVTSSKSIDLMAIDVRMHSYHRNDNGTQECSSATLRSASWVQICVNVTDHYKSNFNNDLVTEINMTPNSPFEIKLEHLYQNGERDAPAMVWLAFEDMSGGLFTLSCQPMETTTTTMTSTTSYKTTTNSPTPTPSTTSVSTAITPTMTQTTTTTPTPSTSTTTITPLTTTSVTTSTTTDTQTTSASITTRTATTTLTTTPTNTPTLTTTPTTALTKTSTPTTTSTTTPTTITSTSTTTTTTSPQTTSPTTSSTTSTIQTTTSTTIPTTSPTTTTQTPNKTLTTTTFITTSPSPNATTSTAKAVTTTKPLTTTKSSTTTTKPSTTTTPVPTTTIKLVTTSTSTAQRPITTTFTTTSRMTTSSKTTFFTLTSSSTFSTTRESANPPPVTRTIVGDGVDDDTQERAVILAIAIPIMVFVITGVGFGIWVYRKRTSSYKPSKASHNGHVSTNAQTRHEHVYFAPFDDADL